MVARTHRHEMVLRVARRLRVGPADRVHRDPGRRHPGRPRGIWGGLRRQPVVAHVRLSLSEASPRLTRMAAKATTRSPGHRCSECGWSAVKWVGRCGECQAWGTVTEIGGVKVKTTAAVVVDRPAIRIGEVDARQAEARTTGVGEFDRVLGGGLVRGAVVLVAGEPGIGKSTLLLDVAARAAREDQTVLYVTGEESLSLIHISEPTRRTPISYAVFCLKKK